MALIINGLVHFFRFDDGANGLGSGQTVINYGSNTQTAQLGSTTGADTNDPAWTATGQRFVGDDRDQLAGGISGLNFATANYTQIFLAKWDNLNTGVAGSIQHPLIAHSVPGDRAGTMLGGGSGYLSCQIGNVRQFSAEGVIADDTWCVVHSLRNGTLGISGVNLGSLVTNNNIANGTQGTNYWIGGAGNGYYMTGDIAAHLVYNRALSDPELLETYNYLRSEIASPRSIVLPDMGGATPSYVIAINAPAPVATTSLDVTRTAPIYTANITAPAPSATANIGLAHTPPVYAANLTASAPLATASATVTHTPPTYTAAINAPAPVATAGMGATNAPPTYSVSVSAAAALASATASVTHSPPVYTAAVSTPAPAAVASADVETTAPTYTADISAAAPVAVAAASATYTAPPAGVHISASALPATASLAATTTIPVNTADINAAAPSAVASLTASTTAPNSGVGISATAPLATTSLTASSTVPISTVSVQATAPLAAASIGVSYELPVVVADVLAAAPAASVSVGVTYRFFFGTADFNDVRVEVRTYVLELMDRDATLERRP